MGQLADRLRIAKLRGDPPIGFTARAADVSKRRALLIGVRGEQAQGGDALIVRGGLSDEAALRTLTSTNEVPVGIEPPQLTHAGAVNAEEAGVDFVVFGVDNTTAAALTRPKLDYVLRIENVPSEGELRALGSLRPLFILVPPIEAPVTLGRAIGLRQVAMMSSAPLGAPVAAEIDIESLGALRDAGVAVLLLNDPTAAEVTALAARIAEIPARPRQHQGGDVPTLPSMSGAEGQEEADEDRAP